MLDEVFGKSIPFPSDIYPFPDDLRIDECIGDQEQASVQLKPVVLQAEVSYAFRASRMPNARGEVSGLFTS